MPLRFVRDFSSITGIAPDGSRVAVPATLAPTIRLALSSGSPVIDPQLPSLPAVPLSELLPAEGAPLSQNVSLPSGRQVQTATSMIQLGSSSMFVPGDYSGGLPSSTGGQGGAIIDLIGKGIGLAGTILGRNAPQQMPGGSQGAILSVPVEQGAMGQAARIGNQVLRATGALPSISTLTTTKEGKPRKLRKDGKPYKRPTMNPLNPRALRRGMKRVQRFAKIASRTISFTKRVRMKKRRR